MGKQQENLNNISLETEKQKTQYTQQKNILLSKKSLYIEELAKLFVEYVGMKVQYAKLKEELPINFLTDGKYIKGYNEAGEFVALYDKYDNYAIIEYEEYKDGSKAGRRISRIYDNNEKEVQFKYNAKNRLIKLIDAKGKKVEYSYNNSDQLISISYDTGEKVSFEYDEENLLSVSEEKTKLQSVLEYTNNKASGIKEYSLVKKISNGKTEEEYVEINSVGISYEEDDYCHIQSVTITEDRRRERYYFTEDRNCREYRLEENGMVTKAEQYEYVPYWKGTEKQTDPKRVRTKAKKSSLYTSMDNFSFEAGDVETVTLNQFNHPAMKTSYEIELSKWTNENDEESCSTESSITWYSYDENQKLIEEKTKIIYEQDFMLLNELISYTKYYYNVNGDVIKTESYVEGEEYTFNARLYWGDFGELMNLKRKFFRLENFDKLVKMNSFQWFFL